MVRLEMRRIWIYLAVAFGFSWTLDLIVFLNGGLDDSPALVPGTPITLALVLILASMWGPTLGHVAARVLTGEGWHNVGLRPQLRRGWPYWVLMWLLPALFSLIGAALFFRLYPQFFDPSMRAMQEQVQAATGEAVPIPTAALMLAGFAQAVLLSPVLNLIGVFGEEFGWRGYLQPKLMPLGFRRAMLLMGVIWGVWHWPVIAMGYNYGTDYPGYPWLGPLAMVWFTLVVGTVLGWSVLRGRSVWPAVIGHGALNGIAGGAALFLTGEPNTLLGPLPVGFIGGIAWSVMALWLFWRAPAPEA